jgi:hypothetical protein
MMLMWNINNISCAKEGFGVGIQSSILELLKKSRDSSVGIATGYGLDDRGVGVRVPVGS